MSVPWGFRRLLAYVHRRYGAPEIWVTENGCDVPGEDQMAFPAVLEDDFRLAFYQVSPLLSSTTVRFVIFDIEGVALRCNAGITCIALQCFVPSSLVQDETNSLLEVLAHCYTYKLSRKQSRKK